MKAAVADCQELITVRHSKHLTLNWHENTWSKRVLSIEFLALSLKYNRQIITITAWPFRRRKAEIWCTITRQSLNNDQPHYGKRTIRLLRHIMGCRLSGVICSQKIYWSIMPEPAMAWNSLKLHRSSPFQRTTLGFAGLRSINRPTSGSCLKKRAPVDHREYDDSPRPRQFLACGYSAVSLSLVKDPLITYSYFTGHLTRYMWDHFPRRKYWSADSGIYWSQHKVGIGA